MLLRGKRKNGGQLVVTKIVVEELGWTKEGTISYSFELVAPESPRLLAVNRGLAPTGSTAKNYRSSIVTERGLGWARLRVLRPRSPSAVLRGTITGRPEDFTLSRLGVRFGRVLLKDELIWHPIPSDNLFAWGTRGRIESYEILVAGEAIGPRSPEQVEGGYTRFRGTPELRTPGLTIVGDVKTKQYKEVTIATPYGKQVDQDIAAAALATVEEARAAIADATELRPPSYEALFISWDDVEPFSCDRLLAVRRSVARILSDRNPLAVHELLHTIAVQTIYQRPLAGLHSYWLYEVLPHLLALAVLRRVLPQGLGEALESLRRCIASLGGPEKLPPPAAVLVPKNAAQHAALTCKAPLVLWSLGAENAEALITCSTKGEVDEKRFYACLGELMGSRSDEFVKRYLRGRNMP